MEMILKGKLAVVKWAVGIFAQKKSEILKRLWSLRASRNISLRWEEML